MSIESLPVTPITIENQLQFNQQVTAHDFMLVLFTAKWCDPCQPFTPLFAEVAAQHPEILFAIADIDVATDFAANFSVTRVPALMAIRERVVVDMVSGAMHAHELHHHIHMWQSVDMTSIAAHFSKKSIVAD